MIRQIVVVASCVLPAVALAREKTTPVHSASADDPAIDISAVKDKLVVLSDGKRHYVVLDAWGDDYQHTYYGDGRRFHAQPLIQSNHQGKEWWFRSFYDPRWKGSALTTVEQKEGGAPYVVCGERKTDLALVDGEARDKLLASAKFYGPVWKHRPYALARDEKGVYYYIDRPLKPEGNKAFRLFSGPRGDLKPLKMTNVVSDSQGDIFTTKTGELRLVLGKKRSVWVAGKKETELTVLPIDEGDNRINRVLVYTDLGVYAGQRLGTPCDDLM